ncbi:S24 family peptidase [Chitinophaga japonensis]|uniref:Phage repressor protein C with HTH and peptisase S24 domain n=1 Tax=Chitinophaga japonensis TaxID=104662 RepID=A0A562T4F4_CHIJA|nr:S24 family peptidase [Chitinophaga japonensis]TWI88253.1 phage repressor protein C with HTH and peptisase S24 domain [Chitinophaga japonensis]
MTPRDRLNEVITLIKKTQPERTNEAVSEQLGYSRNYVSDLLGRKKINKLFCQSLQQRYGVNGDWIMTGQGEMFVSEAVTGSKLHNMRTSYGAGKKGAGKTGRAGVPVFDAPVLSIINGESTPVEHVSLSRFKDCAFCIRVSGDDMCPGICNGDYIFCKEISTSEIIMGDKHLVLTHNGVQVVAYLHPAAAEDDHLSLTWERSSKPATDLALSAIHKIYRISGVIKTF